MAEQPIAVLLSGHRVFDTSLTADRARHQRGLNLLPDLDRAREVYCTVLGLGTPVFDLLDAGWIEFATGSAGGAGRPGWRGTALQLSIWGTLARLPSEMRNTRRVAPSSVGEGSQNKGLPMPHVISNDGTAIVYELQGTGPALVIVDGALCSRAFGPSGAQAARLAEQFSVYTYDRRGRGESGDTQPYAVEREIEDLAAVIGAAGGSAFVYGISVGSVLALRAAAALGATLIPRLALCEPPLSVGDEAKAAFAQEKQHIVGQLAAGRRGEAVSAFMREILPPPALEELRRSPDWALLEAHAPTLAYDYTLLGDGDLPAATTRAVEMPVLLLVGEESADYKHTAVDALVASLPRAELATTDGMGFEPTDELIERLVGFFAPVETV